MSESIFMKKKLSITDFFFLDTEILGVILCLVFSFFFLTHKENKVKGREMQRPAVIKLELKEEWKVI